MFEFIGDLSESKLIPTYNTLSRFQAREVAEISYLYFCALNILVNEPDTEGWVRQYALRTIQFNSFATKRTSGTDLYVLLHALTNEDAPLKNPAKSADFKDALPIDEPTIVHWLRNMAHAKEQVAVTRKFFINLDRNLQVWDSSMRAIRRLAMEWETLDHSDRQLVMTRLLQMFRARAARSELLPFLNALARDHRYELEDVCDKETGENCDGGDEAAAGPKPAEKKPGLLKKLAVGAAAGAVGYWGMGKALGK